MTLRITLKPDPSNTEEYFQFFIEFIEDWYGPFCNDDRIRKAKLKNITAPEILKRWYLLGGNRQGILGGDTGNSFYTPERLKIENGYLMFYTANQGVYSWYTEPEGIDPPVYGKFNDTCKAPSKVADRLSEFLLQVAFFEAAMQCSPLGAVEGSLKSKVVELLLAPLKPAPVGYWVWPEKYGIFYIGPETVAFSCPNYKDWYSVWLSSKETKWVSRLREFGADKFDCFNSGNVSA